MKAPAFRRAMAATVVACLALVLTGSPVQAAGPTITGSGSSFVAIELAQWTADVGNPPYDIKVIYNAISSGQGRDEFYQTYSRGPYGSSAPVVDFAVSDIPYPAPDEAAIRAGGVNFGYVPVSAGGMAFMFNLKDAAGRRIKNLKLSPKLACQIFTGDVKSWTDPAVLALNPDFGGRGKPANENIKVVLRSGGAGTSYIFGEYCQSLAPDVWNKFVGSVPALQQWLNFPGPPLSQWYVFPGAIAAGSSDQNADTVANDATGLGAVALVEAGFASSRSIPVAAVSSNSNPGSFVLPGDDAVTEALSHATADPSKPTVQVLNFDANDPNAYNPSTYSYAIVPLGNGTSAERGAVLAKFLNYAVTTGQEKAVLLNYAPLPQVLIDLSLDLIATVNGAPPRPTYSFPVGAGGAVDNGGDTGGGGGGGGGGGDTGDTGGGGGGGGGGGDTGGGGGGDTGSGTTVAGGTASDGGTSGGGSTGGGSGGGNTNDGGSSADGSSGTVAAGAGGSTVGGSTAGSPTAGGPTTTAKGGGGKTTGTGNTGSGVVDIGAGGSAAAGAGGAVPFQEQTVAAKRSSDSILPLGWVLALGAAGFLAARRRSARPA